ncbi:MAG: metallophosphoesterase family protein [Coriobacteriia bacterium]
MLIGIISDTHGVLPPGVHDAFDGVEHIVHAGDIGSVQVLSELELIAPVTAVSGNTDLGALAHLLPAIASVSLDGVCITVGHKLPDLLGAGASTAADVLVSGHTHVASVSHSGSLLLVNPGSATQPRDSNCGTVGVLDTAGERPTMRVVSL